MATKYSQPAIAFQANLRPGMRFAFGANTPLSLAWLRIIYGEDAVITIGEVIKKTSNPDDCLYRAASSNGHEFNCRAWWLRKCCEPSV